MPAAEPMSQEWNWNTVEGRLDTVVPQVSATAIYLNEAGDIVLRQQQFMEEDSVIVVPKPYTKALIARIQELAEQ